MPDFKFKACRLLLSNVWQKELTLIQRRILGALRSKRRAAEREVSRRENQHEYIKLQTTRKLSLFYGNMRMAEMRKGRGDASYIPFLLHLETRLDVLLVRIHFCQSLAQARQLISHGKVCVNYAVANKIHWKVSPGSLISWKEDEQGIDKNKMHLSVKTLTGKTIVLEVDIGDSIRDLKDKIEDKEGIPSNLQRIVFAGKQLQDWQTLASCDLEKESVLHLSLCWQLFQIHYRNLIYNAKANMQS